MSKFSQLPRQPLGLDDPSADLSETPRAVQADPRLAPAQWLCDRGLRPLSDIAVQHTCVGRRICAIVKLDDNWFDAACAAMTSLLGRDVEIRAAVELCSHPTNAATILRRLSRYHVVICCNGGETVGGPAALLADVQIELRPLEHLEALLDAIWPGEPCPRIPTRIDLVLLPIAIARASSPGEAVDWLRRLRVAQWIEARQQDRIARERAAHEAPCSRSSSSTTNWRAPSVIEPLYPTEPLLTTTHGYGDAAAWGLDLARDIKAYQNGELVWDDVDRGALLVGPPGTGKTRFASALAATCAVPLIATSYAQWQASGEAHMGTLIKAMRANFDKAAEIAPVVLFVDEIDTLPRRDMQPGSDHANWFRPIVNALLECADGSLRTSGIVVIGACNDDRGLDPALTRAGRLDRRFVIGMPDAEALGGILRDYLSDPHDAAIDDVATALAGSLTGADIARLAREARRSARREKRPITARDVLDLALPPETRGPAIVWRVAVHEAGHAVAMMSAGILPECLSLVARQDLAGSVSYLRVANEARRIDLERDILPLLCGRAAEEVVLGMPSAGASGDLAEATTILRKIREEFGLGAFLMPGMSDCQTVESHLRRLYGDAILIVLRHRADILALAELAVAKRVLPREVLRAFAAERGFPGA
ncbi:AAA family ATPase [Jiella pacifica]|uniref:AAA family ATPase n=1 Tax=Jiella pacifica TaxID=2696469 RepID=A0A6N9T7V7_9HYPH|nr:AAA family ATPase [Jiella pacifica]NDW07473.1 AAA family ATPase [Jiella pacifica]